MRIRVGEYLMELGIPVREKTPFEKMPCYLCREYDPWLDTDNDNSSHPCDHRRNYCMAFDNLCKKYEEAGKTFWSAERWRIQNKPSYVFMNHNLWRNHGLATTARRQE